MTSQVSAAALKKVNLLRGLSDKELEKISQLCREHSHPPGELLLAQGQETDSIHIVRKGRVALESQIPERWFPDRC